MTRNPFRNDDDDFSNFHSNAHDIAKPLMQRTTHGLAVFRPQTPCCSDPDSNAWYYSKIEKKEKKMAVYLVK